MSENNIVNRFLASLSDNKKSSSNTLAAYRRDLDCYFEYLKFSGLDYSCVSQQQILSYKQYLIDSGKSVSTVSRCMSSLRSFYKFLVCESLCDSNPTSKVKNDKAEKKYFEVLTEGEIDALLAVPDADSYKGRRDKAMLELMYATGLKVSELMSLNVSDVNIKMGCIKCSSSADGGKSRMILLYPKAVRAIDDYISKSRMYFVADEGENALFVNTNGERMTRQGLWKIIKIYAEKAGIKKSITPHTLRHSFATHLLENGADIRDVKDILGHSDISSTAVYSDYLKSRVNSSYLRFNHRSR